MAKILFLFSILVCFALLCFWLRKKLGKKLAALLFVVLFLAFFIFILCFEYKSFKQSLDRDKLIIAFNQAQNLKCKNIKVHKDNFNYEFGTSSFVSKDKNESLKALIFSIKDCELDLND